MVSKDLGQKKTLRISMCVACYAKLVVAITKEILMDRTEKLK